MEKTIVGGGRYAETGHFKTGGAHHNMAAISSVVRSFFEFKDVNWDRTKHVFTTDGNKWSTLYTEVMAVIIKNGNIGRPITEADFGKDFFSGLGRTFREIYELPFLKTPTQAFAEIEENLMKVETAMDKASTEPLQRLKAEIRFMLAMVTMNRIKREGGIHDTDESKNVKRDMLLKLLKYFAPFGINIHKDLVRENRRYIALDFGYGIGFHFPENRTNARSAFNGIVSHFPENKEELIKFFQEQNLYHYIQY